MNPTFSFINSKDVQFNKIYRDLEKSIFFMIHYFKAKNDFSQKYKFPFMVTGISKET